MLCIVIKDCYCAVALFVGVFPLKEASENFSLLNITNANVFSQVISISLLYFCSTLVLYHILLFFSLIMGLSELQIDSNL